MLSQIVSMRQICQYRQTLVSCLSDLPGSLPVCILMLQMIRCGQPVLSLMSGFRPCQNFTTTSTTMRVKHA